MREIKFRAYLKPAEYYRNDKTGKIYDVYSLDRVSADLVIDNLCNSILKQDIEIMQFTGLFDKNGKEIYEGDIIKFSCIDYVVKSEIIFKDGAFREAYYGYELPKSHHMEVVGNIYENPTTME